MLCRRSSTELKGRKVLNGKCWGRYLSFITIALIQGCGLCDRIPPRIQKVDSRPFSYRVVGADERVHLLRAWAFDFVPDPNIPPYVMVHQWHKLNIKIYWEIIARKPISANDFELTIGEVPDGFEQVIPSPEHRFIPISGKDYNFNIETDWPCYQTYGVDSGFLDFAERESKSEKCP